MDLARGQSNSSPGHSPLGSMGVVACLLVSGVLAICVVVVVVVTLASLANVATLTRENPLERSRSHTNSISRPPIIQSHSSLAPLENVLGWDLGDGWSPVCDVSIGATGGADNNNNNNNAATTTCNSGRAK